MLSNRDLELLNRSRKIVQICYVTDDYQRTIEFLYRTLQFGPWKLLTIDDSVTENARLDAKPMKERYAFRVALTKIGDLQFEVIQPLYGKTVYDRFLKERGRGIHHIKEKLEREQIENRMAESRCNGIHEAFHGDGFQGDEDIDGFWYLDTYDSLGAYYEYGNCPRVNLRPDQYSFWPEEKQPS